MAYDSSGVYTRVSNSFSDPVVGTTISPTDADTYFADIDAALNAYYGTSTSSVAIGTGTKTFTTQASKLFTAGRYVSITSAANSANNMYGQVTSYSGTTLTVSVTATGGSGTLANWTIAIAGAQGPTGTTGPTGPGYTATSVTSVAIASSGSKAFTTQSGLAYTAGARVRASDSSAPSVNYMEGVVTAYSGTSLTFTADRSAGSGTLTSWNINLAGDKGADGAGTGDVVGPAASVDSEIALFSATTGKLIKRASLTGLVKSTSGVASAATAGTDYMHPGTTSLVTIGFTLTPNNIGTVSSGTTTPAAASGNYQYLTNNGAFTLAAPAADCAIDILVTNGASAGSITFSGFTVGSSTGSSYVTTNTNKFVLSIRRINSIATYSWYALQ